MKPITSTSRAKPAVQIDALHLGPGVYTRPSGAMDSASDFGSGG